MTKLPPCQFTPPAIKRHRKARGWTQQQLADKIGVTRQTVQQYENGNIQVARCLRQLSAALDIPPADLLPPYEPKGEADNG